MNESEKRKQLIIEHAYEMVKVHGWENISMRKLSAQADISLPLIYKSFVNKEAMMVDVVKQSIVHLEYQLEFIFNNSSNIEQDAIEILKDFFASNEFAFDFVFKQKATEQITELRKQIIDSLSKINSQLTTHPLDILSTIIGRTILVNEYAELA